jgi:hypothetical protein
VGHRLKEGDVIVIVSDSPCGAVASPAPRWSMQPYSVGHWLKEGGVIVIVSDSPCGAAASPAPRRSMQP